MASFGWSFGDIIAGINVVWTVYEALSDGPLNAKTEFKAFFDEFALITHYLGEYERKAQLVEGDTVARLHRELREQCSLFVKKHMLLIQDVNPRSRAIRDGRSTWLRNVAFTTDQAVSLYQKVTWPMERKELSRLRKKLMVFLDLATHSYVAAQHSMMAEQADISRNMLLAMKCVCHLVFVDIFFFFARC